MFAVLRLGSIVFTQTQEEIKRCLNTDMHLRIKNKKQFDILYTVWTLKIQHTSCWCSAGINQTDGHIKVQWALVRFTVPLLKMQLNISPLLFLIFAVSWDIQFSAPSLFQPDEDGSLCLLLLFKTEAKMSVLCFYFLIWATFITCSLPSQSKCQCWRIQISERHINFTG